MLEVVRRDVKSIMINVARATQPRARVVSGVCHFYFTLDEVVKERYYSACDPVEIALNIVQLKKGTLMFFLPEMVQDNVTIISSTSTSNIPTTKKKHVPAPASKIF